MRTEEEMFVETRYGIVYEDDSFLVADKPAPLPVHSVGRFKEKNLLSLLRKDRGTGAEEFRIVNRLDSETSGLVLVAKSKEMAGKLGVLFERRQVFKEYHAVIFGVPESKEGTLSTPLGWNIQNHHRVRVPDPDGETAKTDYRVVEEWKETSLVRIIPHTGRTHQIRAHLAFIGHPVVGDKIYRDPAIFERYIHEGWQEEMLAVVKAERLLLHASKLEFHHPEGLTKMEFTSPVPACFTQTSKGSFA